jgi:hypothetical protein
MTFTEFFENYLLTIPTMATLAFIGVVSFIRAC